MINHRISCFHMSVLVMEFSHANGQPPRGLESNQYDLKPAMSIVLSALVVALVFIATLSLVIRQCSNSADAPPTTSAASGVNQRKSHGLNPDVIDKLPTFTYSVVKDVRIGRDTLECAICLSDFKEDETLRLVPKCNHVFHIECIDMWLASQVTCPVCRANLNQEIIIEMPKQETTSDASDHRNENSPGEIREVRDEVMITKNEILEKFMRSHSTGHSLPVERNMERHTLKLPEEVMRQIVANAKLKRTTSFGVLESEESKSRGRETDERSEHWVFSMTPSFVMRAGSVEGSKGEAVSNGKRLFESVKMPLSCINFKDDGLGESSGVGRLQI